MTFITEYAKYPANIMHVMECFQLMEWQSNANNNLWNDQVMQIISAPFPWINQVKFQSHLQECVTVETCVTRGKNFNF